MSNQRSLESYVYGGEQEYGIMSKKCSNTLFQEPFVDFEENLAGHAEASGIFLTPQGFHQTGGRIYLDGYHIEGCTPECSTVKEYISHCRAVDSLVNRTFNKIKQTFDNDITLYRTSGDMYDTYFGFHQNISVMMNKEGKDASMPLVWDIIEPLITGAGWMTQNGTYVLSHRLHSLSGFFSSTINRSFCRKPGFRLQRVNSDGNMCQSAMAMKMELARCVLFLAAEGDLPGIIDLYDAREYVKDQKALCSTTSDWTLQGMPREYRCVIDLHHVFYEHIRGVLYGMHSQTDRVIDMYGETIELLRKIKKHPDALVGRLDWVTLKHLLAEAEKDQGKRFTKNKARAVALDYYLVGDEGLFTIFEREGFAEKWVSNEEIERASHEPPTTTRAYARGEILKHIEETRLGGAYFDVDWESIYLFDELGSVYRLDTDDASYPYRKNVAEFKADWRAWKENNFLREEIERSKCALVPS